MTPITRHSSDDSDPRGLGAQKRDLAFIRSEMLQFREDLVGENEPLREAATEWLNCARELPAETTSDHISRRLSQIARGNAMYRTPGTTNPQEEEFHPDCEGCDHYEVGSMCPIIADHRVKRQRKQLIEQADSPVELRTDLRKHGIKHGCHIILDELDIISEEYEPLLKRGQLLLLLIQDRLLRGEDTLSIRSAIERAEAGVDTAIPDDRYDTLEGIRGDPSVGLFAPRDDESGEAAADEEVTA